MKKKLILVKLYKMTKRVGRKSIAQTPAPKSDIKYGSKVNKAGSASAKESKTIQLSEKTLNTLKDKLAEFKKKHPNKKNITLSDLKAVYRRGSGAYSKSHRPTITGGAPNTRAAWSFARVNKFLLKAGGTKVKAAYVQDDDLMKYEDGGLIAPNGKESNLTPEQYKLVRTPEFKAWFGNSKVVDENGEPLVVYRGNIKKQEDLGYEFITNKKNISHKSLNNEFGFFFTNDVKVAKKYMDVDIWDEVKGGSLTSVFLLANRLLDLRFFGIKIGRQNFVDGLLAKGIKFDGFEYLENQIVNADVYEDWGYFIYEYFDVFPKLKDLFISNGYDGVIFIEESRSIIEYSVYVVFKSNQIKLADGINTTFDIDNQDIRYKDGGKLFNDKELLAKWKKGESIGFTGEAHLKAKGLIPRADGTKRKSEKYMEDGGEVTISNENYNFFVGGDEYFGKAIKQNGVTIGGIEYDEEELKGIEINTKFRKKGLAKKAVKALFEKNPNLKSVYIRAVPKAKTFWEKIGTKFDNYNEDAGLWEGNLKKYEYGGELGQDVVCENCGWEWNTVDSDANDKYVCHKCGFDNTLYYSNDIFAKGGKTKGGDCYLKAGSFCLLPNMHEFIGEPYLVHAEVRGQGKIEGLRYGHAWVEDDENVYDYSNGRQIVMPKQIYYLLGDIKTDNPKKYQRYSFPEARAKMLKTKHYGSWDIETDYKDGGLINPSIKNSNLEKEQYKIVRTPQFKAWFGDWQKDPNNSSVVRESNGEPMVVWHGSPSKFNIFKTDENGIFYFAENAGYAEYFTDGTRNIKPYFLNIRKMFDGFKFDTKPKEAKFFIKEFGISTKWLKSQNKLIKFWELLRHDEEFRQYLKNQGYDGVGYFEDNDDSWVEKSKAYGCFYANQIKLANGINTTFVTKNKDVRYEKGGQIDPDDKKTKDMITHKSGSAGGMLVGNRHSEGGIKAINKASNTPLEMEGGEVVITRNAVSDDKKYEFEGEMLTNREILSKINESGGGVSFAKGGDIMSKFKKPMSIEEIANEYGIDSQYVENQLEIGTKHELEHTNDKEIANIIALHHIGEKPNYYELVEKYKLEQGGQPSKFWHKSEKETYEIPDFIKKERMATEELLCSSDTRISKAIICRAKIDFCEKKEANTRNLEEKNAWSEVKHIWEACLQEIKNGVVYEYKDGGECGCASSKKYKNGGLAYGNSHDKGGMPLKVQSTGQNIEIEGGEGVVNKRSMQIKKRIDFEGKKLTPCQIVSKINQMGGGVKFKCDDVAEILEKDGSF
jgi:hypothetical protein